MPHFLLTRLGQLLFALLSISFLFFCLERMLPGDPARLVTGPMAPATVVEAARERLGLDQPIFVQFKRFLFDVAQGDLGTSLRTRQPITSDILRLLPATLELVLLACVLGAMIAACLCVLQILAPRSSMIRILILGSGSTPIYLTGLLLIYLLWYRLELLPGFGRSGLAPYADSTGFAILDGLLLARPDIVLDALSHLLLPAITLALPMGMAVGRALSSSLADVWQQPYIRAARGRGFGELSLLLHHGLRNAAMAPLSMFALQIRLLYGNLLITERIFGWPGIGNYTVQAFAVSDLPVILAVSMVFTVFYVFVNLLIEIVQKAADPRI